MTQSVDCKERLTTAWIAAASFAEELKRTFDNSMGSISYKLSRGFLHTDGMNDNEDLKKKNNVVKSQCSCRDRSHKFGINTNLFNYKC